MAIETKIKKKIFVKIIAPKQFHEQIVGETTVTDSRLLIGRKVTVNMMTLTNNPKDQNAQVKFVMTTLRGNDSVNTELESYALLPAYIRKLIRKEKMRVDSSFVVKTADNKSVRIKPFFLTIGKTKNSVLTALRRKSQELLKLHINKASSNDVVIEILSRKLQDKLRKDLAKVYPLKYCEIREFKFVKDTVKETVHLSETSASEEPQEADESDDSENHKKKPKKEEAETQEESEKVQEEAQEEFDGQEVQEEPQENLEEPKEDEEVAETSD